ncbi:hypothetical protein AHAS_Ahas20G0239600 [Arachis hypogaea]
MGKKMRLVIILQFPIIRSKRKFRKCCFLEFKDLKLAPYLSRVVLFSLFLELNSLFLQHVNMHRWLKKFGKT